jgi:hypothetical protein
MMNGELLRNLLLARMDEMLQKSPLEILMVGVLLLLLPALVAGTPPLKPLNSIMMWKTSHEVVDGEALQVEVDKGAGRGGSRACHKVNDKPHEFWNVQK